MHSGSKMKYDASLRIRNIISRSPQWNNTELFKQLCLANPPGGGIYPICYHHLV